MYRRDEDDEASRPLFGEQRTVEDYRHEESSNNGSTKAWLKVVAILASLGTVALLMVTFTGSSSTAVSLFGSSSSHRGKLLAAKRIQLAKEGSLMYSSLSDDEKMSLFDEFKKKFRKDYTTKKEEKERFDAFLTSLHKADQRNAKEKKAGGTAVHGLTIFSDLTPKEFKEAYLGYLPTAEKKATSELKKATVEKYEGAATSVDWTGVYTTPVQNQGYCGSCWAFSAAQQIESDSIRAGILTTDDVLSVQQVVACDNMKNSVSPYMVNYGCEGGNTETAYAFINAQGGLVKASDYPYEAFWGSAGTCDDTKTEFVVTVKDYFSVVGEEAMADYVLSQGPLSACVDASDWATYQSGIVSVCEAEADHCVQIVGVNLDEGYWLIRNSWGTSWGEDGFIRLKTFGNVCGITTDPTFTEVTLVQTENTSA